jgi:hypothetical protein
MSGQLRAPASLPPGIADWVGPRACLVDVEKRKYLTPPGLELRPSRRQSLYRLRYPYHFICLLLRTASVVKWSEFMATDPEVPGSIPDATRFSEE